MKERGRTYYHQNHTRQLELAIKRKNRYILERKKWIENIKNHPCMDCGKIYPAWVMDFDHKEGEIKVSSISAMITHNPANFERIKEEISKCDLVCANCHRQRTHDRIQLKMPQ